MTGTGGNRLTGAKRLVVKIGSALLVDESSGLIRHDWLATLAADVAARRAAGQEVLIVSSGAIAVGRRYLNITGRVLRLEEKQAAAATGQIQLAHAYREALSAHNITAAQILLTLDDTERRRRHLNARATMRQILDLGAVPIINENDTVATEEIRFGDNDRLAARVAAMVGADVLVLLSDIDGLYDSDPQANPSAMHIGEVTAITPEIEAMAGKVLRGYASGGMVTKLLAAKIALAGGCHMAIGDGRQDHPLQALADDGRCTWFVAEATPYSARKKWIAGSLKPKGALNIDDGAVRALKNGRSLLPAGVSGVSGRFERGDLVTIISGDNRDLGRGLSAYSSADTLRIAGHKTSEIEEILGYRGRNEVIHRDDLVLD